MERFFVWLTLSLLFVPQSVAAAMTLTSGDVKPNTPISTAQIYPRCGGDNISPRLAWSGVPVGTKSFVLTMIDLDVKPAQWSHWIVVDIPPKARVLARGLEHLPQGAMAIVSNFGDAAYAGPCPPSGTGVHHYQFKIWALRSTTVALAPDEKATVVTETLSRLALDNASLIGTVAR